MLVLRDDRHEEHWQFTRLQLTMLSSSIALTELEQNLDDGLNPGIYCLGPSDPWDTVARANANPVVYWLPLCIFENAPIDARENLRTQVSTCPLWTFSTQIHTVWYVVHCLL